MRTRERDDIYAVEGGTVLYALKTPSAYGYRLYIRHKDGTTAMYGHMKSFAVKKGQEVEEGELIGTIGDTGNCPSGKHLHINYFSKYAKALTGSHASDPTFWIKLHSWPTNTACSGGYHEIYQDAEGNNYPHEGIDMYYSVLIPNWEQGNINPMIQDLRIQK